MGPGALRQRWTLIPDHMSARFYRFPYPAERITGTLILNFGGGEPDRVNVDLAGYASDQLVGVKVVMTGTKPDLSAVVDVWGKNIPLDERLLTALRNAKQQASAVLAASFHPTGLADFRVHSEWRPGCGTGGGRLV